MSDVNVDATASADATAAAATDKPMTLTEVIGHTLVLTLNRPEAMNSVNQAVASGVAAALERAKDDPDVWCFIITGTGRAFCAGADLKAVARGEDTYVPGHKDWGWAGYVSHFIPKPTIAAVNGFALGGGTEMTLASDLAVALETATFGLPEVKRGIIAAAGGSFRLARQIPWKIGLEMLYTGEPITAHRALELGLVNRVVPTGGSVLDAALELAERINANAPLSVQASKRVAYGAINGEVPLDDQWWATSSRESRDAMASEDSKEGPLAFSEKRAPVWKGR
jgi:crotonobetainyl-CoA hydratase